MKKWALAVVMVGLGLSLVACGSSKSKNGDRKSVV